MRISEVKKLKKPIDRLLYLIQERESIRLKKEAGLPRPWTDDEILHRYRFCNVRRMDDRVSRWLLKNWYEPNFNHKNMLLACALARFFNLPASLETIGFPDRWLPKIIKHKLRERRDNGNTVFNGAYIVTGKNAGSDKIASVVDYYVRPLLGVKIDSSSFENTWQTLTQCTGIGSFMAGQITADLRWAVKGSWADAKFFAPMGPGSKRGMNRLESLPINHPIKPAHFSSRLLEVIRICRNQLPTSITERLEAIDYQNCLCEFDKYERTLWDNRKPKQIYKPT